jgi:hypothetical protein
MPKMQIAQANNKRSFSNWNFEFVLYLDIRISYLLLVRYALCPLRYALFT